MQKKKPKRRRGKNKTRGGETATIVKKTPRYNRFFHYEGNRGASHQAKAGLGTGSWGETCGENPHSEKKKVKSITA